MTQPGWYSLVGQTGFCLAPIGAGMYQGTFDATFDPGLLEAIEGMTNDCVRDEIGRIQTVPPRQRIYGDDAHIVMGCFAHWDMSPTPFSDGSYPAFIFSLDRATAIDASRRKMSSFFSATREPAIEEPFPMTLYGLMLAHKVMDCRGQGVGQFSAALSGGALRRSIAPGAIFLDTENVNSAWVVAFEAKLISACRPIDTIEFRWNGKSVVLT